MDTRHITDVAAMHPTDRPNLSLHGRWLLIARLSWCVVTLLSLAIFVNNLSDQFSEFSLFWFTSDPAPDFIVREGLEKLGLNSNIHAWYGLSIYVVRAAIFYLVGLLLFWRKSDERLALLVSFFLVTLPVGDVDPPVLHALAAEEPVRGYVTIVLEAVAFTLAIWLVFLFPDGRFRPRWTSAVAACWLLMGVGTLFLPGSAIDMGAWAFALSFGFIPAVAALAVGVQIWRYRHISNPVERQQAKWFALGLTIVLVEFAVGNLLTGNDRLTWPAVSPTRVVQIDLLLYTVHNLAFLAIPFTLAIAVLRYRLWDIDLLINRALVYGSLSAVLAAVYFGSVVLLEGLVRAITGQGSMLAITAATLATAALVQPLRRHLQATIDRRFYRRKYDATRTLSEFSSTLRNETSLGRIQSDLLAVVEETMRPAHVSLWLRAELTQQRP